MVGVCLWCMHATPWFSVKSYNSFCQLENLCIGQFTVWRENELCVFYWLLPILLGWSHPEYWFYVFPVSVVGNFTGVVGEQVAEILLCSYKSIYCVICDLYPRFLFSYDLTPAQILKKKKKPDSDALLLFTCILLANLVKTIFSLDNCTSTFLDLPDFFLVLWCTNDVCIRK